jgi:hypothetical protein
MTKEKNPSTSLISAEEAAENAQIALSHSQKCSLGQAQSRDERRAIAFARHRGRTKRGKWTKVITDDQWDEVIEMIRDGFLDSEACEAIGIAQSWLSSKKKFDVEFAERWSHAVQEAFVSHAMDAMMIADGVEGFSSGDVKRDKLRVDTRIELAKRFARKVLGDVPLIDNRSVTIITRDERDGSGDIIDLS